MKKICNHKIKNHKNQHFGIKQSNFLLFLKITNKISLDFNKINNYRNK